MKLLYIFILLLGTIQWVRTSALNISFSPNSSTPADHLIKVYDEELALLAPDICIKLKNIAEQILKDETVQKANSPLMQEFKKNVTHFQQIYPFYERWGLNESLVSTFADIVVAFYNLQYRVSNESLYIRQLIRKLGYDEIREKYKSELKKFVTDKFLPKFEQLKIQDSTQNFTDFEASLIKWVNMLKECKEYECYLNKFTNSTSKFFDRLFKELFLEILDMLIIHTHNTTVFAKALFEDKKLSEFSPHLRQQLKNNLKDIINISENTDNVSQIFFERQLITAIFDSHGYAQFEMISKINGIKTTEHDYLKDFENFKAKRTQEELSAVSDAIKRLVSATNSQERAEVFKTIQEMRLDTVKENDNQN